MVWYDFLLKKEKKTTKVSLHQCKKILGQGAFGITYLTPDNLVVKIETYQEGPWNIFHGDTFGMEVLPTLSYEVRKHFTQIYGIQIIDYNPTTDLKCLETSNKLYNLNSFEGGEKFKVSVMEYGGETVNSIELTNELRIKAFKQLFNPICVMMSNGYYHNDLHTGNITYDSKKDLFKIIDYNVMQKPENVGYSIDYKFINWNLSVLFDNFLLNKAFIDYEKYGKLETTFKNLKYDGPSKYIKNLDLLIKYEMQVHPGKYEDLFTVPLEKLPKTFKPKDIIEALYYIENYNFDTELTKYDNSLTLNQHYDKVIKNSIFEISKKITKMFDIELN
jgi:hypothetical protein